MRSSESIAFTDYVVFCVGLFVAYITMILIGRDVIIPFWAIIRDILTLTFWTFYPVLGFNNARVLGASFELEVNYNSLEAWTPLYPSDGFNTYEMIGALMYYVIWCDLQRGLQSINVWIVTSTSSRDLPCHFINDATGLFFMIRI